jgi:hypothetical protein
MSASRIKKYLQCPEAYHQSYENGVKGTADHLVFGTLMHTTFERWYQEDVMIEEIYEQEWRKADIVDPEFYRDGFEIIHNFLGMNDKEQHVPIGFEMPFAIDIQNNKIYDTSVVDWHDKDSVKAFLKELEEADAPIIYGFIDRVEYDMDTDTLRIIDYKTSRIPLTQSEADEDVQMSMYALVARYLFPEYRRVVQELQYVRLGTPVRTSRTQSELDVFREWLISIFYKIKEDTAHKATLNKYCGWCNAKAGCVAYKELVNGEAEDFTMDGLSDDELQDQLEKIAIHLKILDGRKKEIEAYLKDKLRSSDNIPIQTRNGEMFLTPNLRTSYDVESIIRLFPDDFPRLLSPNKTEVDKLAKGDADIIRQLEQTSNKYYIAPTLRKKKSK